MGPLISQGQHCEKVMDYIATSDAQRGRAARHRRRPPVAPLVLPGGSSSSRRCSPAVTDDDAIAREEIFGPVMSRALLRRRGRGRWRGPTPRPSGSRPGCSPGTSRGRTGWWAPLEAGTCWINTYNLTPIDALRRRTSSGIGRENGRAALDHYSQLKSVYVELGDVAAPY
jgi:betaine-aldehyde dehydrogenase